MVVHDFALFRRDGAATGAEVVDLVFGEQRLRLAVDDDHDLPHMFEALDARILDIFGADIHRFKEVHVGIAEVGSALIMRGNGFFVLRMLG